MWSGGTYTKGNAATGGWTGDASLGIGIEAGRHDTQDNDFATGINQCLNKDGSNAATGNLNIGGFKVTNVAAGTARSDLAILGQVQDGTSSYLGTTGGTTTAFTVTATPTITTLVTGATYTFKANAANGAAATLKIDSTAATTMQRQGTALAGNEFKANDFVSVIYDGTNFQITNIASAPLFVDRTNNRVGIGTTAPATLVDIQSTANLHSTTNFSADVNGPEIRLQKSRGATIGTNTIVQSGDTSGLISFYGANGTGYERGAYFGAIINATPGASSDMPMALVFGTAADGTSGGSERVRIDKDGKVSFLSTNVYNGATLNADCSTASAACLYANHTGSSMQSTAAVVVAKADNTSTTSQVFVQFLINNRSNGSGQINANGASQAAFGSYSDERLKENIVDLPSQLANIFALRPVEFDYKDGSGHQIGFVAQEVQDIYPDLIGEGVDGYLTLSGLGKNEARMIKAFQEFAELTQAKLAALEARVAELEA